MFESFNIPVRDRRITNEHRLTLYRENVYYIQIICLIMVLCAFCSVIPFLQLIKLTTME